MFLNLRSEDPPALEPDGSGAGPADTPAPDRLPPAQEVPRDESGAVIPSDPADDLAGYPTSEDDPIVLPSAVDERELRLADLYGQHDAEQLRNEREILRSRFRSELELAFDLEHERGNYVTVKPGDLVQSEPRLALDGSPLLSSTRTDTDPATLEIEAHVMTLEQDAYPSLYELRDTIEWLDDRIGD